MWLWQREVVVAKRRECVEWKGCDEKEGVEEKAGGMMEGPSIQGCPYSGPVGALFGICTGDREDPCCV
jgi:hypothetical protein